MKKIFIITLLFVSVIMANAKVNLAALKASAEAGDSFAQYQVGWYYLNGVAEGISRDEAQAITWLKKSAENDFGAASYYLGYLYCNGEVVEQDMGTAYSWFAKALSDGMSEAKDMADYCKKQFEAKVQSGNSLALYQLASFYAKGLYGYPQDNAKAISLYGIASDGGYGPASFLLGEMYDSGDNVEKDCFKALKYYDRAIQAGIDKAKNMIDACLKTIESRADSGNKDMQYNLGLAYLNGNFGIQKDQTKAIAYLEKSAENGVGDAACCLGMLYDNGSFGEKNIEKAYQWYSKASELGAKDAEEKANACKDKLDAIKKAEAEKTKTNKPRKTQRRKKNRK